ncbi:PREDICTED: translocase of chloroplast 159, chloroplastic isoform X1 [Camelina sativa]|uniref:Translocase of chloroplast 159, chloroplastic isoform X1 n=3 Tax=Camelina sativa TaxID=90675 RepID=A0ABM0VH11_CAMSA|nr:PREDICTED: translocase of chloroplast 159, chloroplastic isoform X1 [Camelina sativa]
MDSKSVTPEPTNPYYASGQSGKTYASVVAAAAAAAASKDDGGAVSSGKELDSEALSGNSDKGVADDLPNADKEKDGGEGDSLKDDSLKEDSLKVDSATTTKPEVVSGETIGEDDVSSLSPKPEDVSDGVGVAVEEKKVSSEGVEDVKDDGESKIENGSVDVGEKQASADGVVVDENPETETQTETVSVSKVKDVEEDVGVKKDDDEVKQADETNEKEGELSGKVDVDDKIDSVIEEDGVKLTDKGDVVVDSSPVESVHVDVAKPGVAVVGDAKGSEELKINADKEILQVSNKFDQIGHDDGGGFEPESDKATEEVGEKLTSGADSPKPESVDTNASEPEVVAVQSGTEPKDMVEANGLDKGMSYAEVIKAASAVADNGTKEEESVSSGVVNEEEGVKLTNKGYFVVDSSAIKAVDVDVAKPGVVVVGDVEASEVLETDGNIVDVHNKFEPVGQVEGGGVELESDKATEEVRREKLTSEGDSIVDSSVVESVDADINVAEPGIVVVGAAKEAEIKEDGGDDEVEKTIPSIEEPDDLTAAYDGNIELAAKEISEAAKVESDEPKVDVEEKELPVSESSNVDSIDVKEDSNPAAESQFEANPNPEVPEVSEGDNAEEGGNKLPVEDIVSSREFNFEGKEVDQEPSGEGVIGVDGSESEEETEEMIFGSSEAAKQFLAELEKASSGIEAHSDEANISNSMSDRIDGQIVTDSDEDVDTEDEGGEKMFDSAALAALLKAATGGGSSEGGNFTITSQDGTKLFSMDRPAGLSSSLRPLKPAAAPRANRSNIFSNPNVTMADETEVNLSEEEKQKLEKLQSLRVKFLRLLQRLGHSAEDSIAAQVLYRLALLAGRQTGQLFSLDAAKKKAVESEAEGNEDLNFSLNILVLGKAGVGKSATINSILGNQKTSIDAFGLSTTSVREISETVGGVKINFIDTPGLKSAAMDQSTNAKMLSSVKKVMKKCPPDIVLYVDRLDTQTRDLNNLPLLKTVTASLGSSIWKNAIVTLTHAASAPPDGPSGTPLSYDVFVAQCSHIVQQSIGQAVGDLRLMNPSLMNPVSLVENHPLCRKNREGVKVLPNGQTWRPQLLLLCYSLKVLSEANSLLKPQEPIDHRKVFGFRVRSPPLPYLLSWLLQSRAHPKLPGDQGGDSVDSDIEIDDVSDSEQDDGEDDEYDQLPPFKPLRKTQLAKLSKEQRKAYFEEYDYRVKLLQKKQWREELKRMKEMKKNGKKVGESEFGYLGEEDDPENGAPAAVPVPLPDMVLPPSFDSDNSAYRYRFLEPTSQLLTRPVLDTHGWDHDCGYDGVNAEHSLAVANRFPATATVQVTKDKKEFNIHLDSSVSAKHGENGSTMAGFDIQNVGKQLAYVVRGETKFKNLRKNKTTVGGSVTFLGENIATGVKLEDQIALGKRFVLVGSTGTMRSQGDSAYGANLEVRLREADFPIGQDQSSLGLSLVKWRGDLALGANLQSQVSVGRNSKIALRAGLNNKMSGQITVRTSSSDQLQIALTAILPIAMSIYKSIRPEATNDKYSMY